MMKYLLSLSLTCCLALVGHAQQGPTLVQDIFPGADGSRPNNLFEYNGQLLFRAKGNDSLGVELWISDGTPAGTNQVLDINTDPGTSAGNSNPDNYVIYQDSVYFKARSPEFGDELWVTDGTTANTRQVLDIQEGDGNANPFDIIVFNNLIYFTANNGNDNNSSELWSSDGTAAGTNLVVDINPGGPGNPIFKTVYGDRFVFTGNDGTTGSELWISDGTAEGTMLVKDIRDGGNASPSQYFVWNDEVYFRANDGTNGNELWKTDGTEEGTVLVKDINPDGNSAPSDFFVFQGMLFFVADDGATGDELWMTDGTEEGTVLAADINPGPEDSDPEQFIVVDAFEQVIFVATNAEAGRELFFYAVFEDEDGVTVEVDAITDINPGPADSDPEDLLITGSALYFSAENDDFGRELYVFTSSDEPIRISDINPGPASSEIDDLFLVGDQLFFEAETDSLGDELYVYTVLTSLLEVSENDQAIMSGDTLDFGTLIAGVGLDSTRTIVLTNVGTGNLDIIAANLVDLSDPFSSTEVDEIELNFLEPLETLTATVTFAPGMAGTFIDSFQIQILGSAPVTIYVTGTAIAAVPLFELAVDDLTPIMSGDVIDFGDLFINQDSTRSITVTNTGNVELQITALNFDGDNQFLVEPTGFSNELDPGESSSFFVIYTPVTEGVATAQVTIVSNTGNDVALTLTGSATLSSVNEFGIKASRVYPNPTANFLTVELSDALLDGQYRIFSNDGRLLGSGDWPRAATTEQIDMSGLPTGTYQVEISAAEGRLLLEVVKR